MVKNRKPAFCLFTVLFLAFWNLFDFLWKLVITHSEYRFSIGTDLIGPLAIALALGCLLFLRKETERPEKAEQPERAEKAEA